jgi:hypothetical protein
MKDHAMPAGNDVSGEYIGLSDSEISLLCDVGDELRSRFLIATSSF